jgi:glycosyltransferase involved in cell wall biosynthesis
LIIVNSSAGAEHLTRQRWRVLPGAVRVIPNGIAAGAVVDPAAARTAVRSAWGISEDALVFAVVGRLDPVKGQRTFLTAAAEISAGVPEARFVIVGDGPEPERSDLVAHANDRGLGDRVLWAGHRTDMSSVYCAIDVIVSASTSEGFSNAIAEGMQAGAVPVVTDVGDSAALVGDTGEVVPPADPVALAAAMTSVAKRGARARHQLGLRAQARVTAEFGLDRMVERTEQALLEVTAYGE